MCDYAERRSEPAFAELVRRHVDLVYSAALRMVRNTHLAEDVTQTAFVALAQNASQLANRPVLSGWLHRTAQNLAANAVRSKEPREISTPDSQIHVWVIPTNEEYMIALDVKELLGK